MKLIIDLLYRGQIVDSYIRTTYPQKARTQTIQIPIDEALNQTATASLKKAIANLNRKEALATQPGKTYNS